MINGAPISSDLDLGDRPEVDVPVYNFEVQNEFMKTAKTIDEGEIYDYFLTQKSTKLSIMDSDENFKNETSTQNNWKKFYIQTSTEKVTPTPDGSNNNTSIPDFSIEDSEQNETLKTSMATILGRTSTTKKDFESTKSINELSKSNTRTPVKIATFSDSEEENIKGDMSTKKTLTTFLSTASSSEQMLLTTESPSLSTKSKAITTIITTTLGLQKTQPSTQSIQSKKSSSIKKIHLNDNQEQKDQVNEYLQINDIINVIM